MYTYDDTVTYLTVHCGIRLPYMSIQCDRRTKKLAALRSNYCVYVFDKFKLLLVT